MVKAFAYSRLNHLIAQHLSLMLLLMIGLLVAFPLNAETRLNASVDRSKIYAMDTLNLTVEGEIDVDFSFGGLMNFGLNQTEKPDISALEADFEILDTQQSYNMQSINGEAKAQVSWRYTLAPRRTGVLEIPPIKFKDAQTKALQITVNEGKAPRNSSEPPTVFLEVSTDKTEAYVQEQIIYTLRLYTQGLINGELSEPNSPDAIIEPFGEQKKYYRMAFDQRYEVVERQYLIFPQKSGQLDIAPQEFQGVTIAKGRRSRIKDVSDEVNLTIKAPPASFSGKTWLPATSLMIDEEWQGDPASVKAGESLSRKVVLSSLGLLGSALPPTSMKQNRHYKLYTDKPQIETVQHEHGAQATRVDSFAIVALKTGEIELEEIRIPWWDIVNDVERVAVIPASRLTIVPNPDLPHSQQKQSGPQTAPVPATTETDDPTLTSETAEPDSAALSSTQTEQIQSHLWQTLAAVFFILWALTCLLFYRKIANLTAQLNARPFPKPNDNLNEKQLFDEAIKSAQGEDKQLIQKILFWLESYPDLHPTGSQTISLQDLKAINADLYVQLSAFEAQNYAPQALGNTLDSQQVVSLLKALRQQLQQAESSGIPASQGLIPKRSLEPFYQ